MNTPTPLRRRDKAGSEADARALLLGEPFVHLATTDPDGNPLLRVVHIVEHRGAFVFHGGLRGEKVPALRGPVVLSVARMVAEIPSHFTHPERACPATTFYRSAMVHGVVEELVDLDEKAAALQALMERYQPGGGFRPITADDPLYEKAVRGVRVWAVQPTSVVGKVALGTSKPLAWKQKALAGLWQAGELGAVAELSRAWGIPVALGPEGVGLGLPGPEDTDAVVDLLVGQYWTVGQTREALARAWDGTRVRVVARDDQGRVIATARAISDGARLAYVMDVAVHPSWRGRGVGKAVMDLLLDHPGVRGCSKVTLRTRDAGAFYAQLGFERAAPLQGTSRWMKAGLAEGP